MGVWCHVQNLHIVFQIFSYRVSSIAQASHAFKLGTARIAKVLSLEFILHLQAAFTGKINLVATSR
jgi:hypothetical protein